MEPRGFRDSIYSLIVCWFNLYAFNDLAEYVTNGWTKDGKDYDNYDSDQNKDQSIFYKALAFLLQLLQHMIHLLSLKVTNFDYIRHGTKSKLRKPCINSSSTLPIVLRRLIRCCPHHQTFFPYNIHRGL